jgi:hypothetical protein
MVSTSKGDIKIWNVKKNKLYRIAVVRIRAARDKGYAVSV